MKWAYIGVDIKLYKTEADSISEVRERLKRAVLKEFPPATREPWDRPEINVVEYSVDPVPQPRIRKISKAEK